MKKISQAWVENKGFAAVEQWVTFDARVLSGRFKKISFSPCKQSYVKTFLK